jgi:hypothetical protein
MDFWILLSRAPGDKTQGETPRAASRVNAALGGLWGTSVAHPAAAKGGRRVWGHPKGATT